MLQQKYSGFGIWESNIDGFIYGERYFETINKVNVKFWCAFEKTKEFEESEALMWTGGLQNVIKILSALIKNLMHFIDYHTFHFEKKYRASKFYSISACKTVKTVQPTQICWERSNCSDVAITTNGGMCVFSSANRS